MTQEDPRILELRRMRSKALEGGGAERIKRQKAKGKQTARERIDLLLDPGTFNEIEPFITHSGRRAVNGWLRGNLPAECAILRRDPAGRGHAGTLCRWCGVFPCPAGPCHYG